MIIISYYLILDYGRRGGIVGLTFITSCIGRPFTPARLAVHAKQMLEVGGDCLPSLGTDYLGMSSTPEGLEDVSRLGALTSALKEAGISSDFTEGILNDNAYRFVMQRSGRW